MEFDPVQRLRQERDEARTEGARLLNSWHSLHESLVRRSDELRATRRDLEGTRAELAAAHAGLAGLPGDDGLWELTARFDYLTGRRVNQALHAMIASLRQGAGDASRSYPQRAADALPNSSPMTATTCGPTPIC